MDKLIILFLIAAVLSVMLWIKFDFSETNDRSIQTIPDKSLNTSLIQFNDSNYALTDTDTSALQNVKHQDERTVFISSDHGESSIDSKVHENSISELESYLTEGHYFEGVTLYDRKFRELTLDQSKVYRNKIFQFNKTLHSENRSDDSIELLSIYIEVFPDDVEAIILLADVYHGSENYKQELDVLLRAYGQSYVPETLEQIQLRLRIALSKYTRLKVRRFEYYEPILFRYPNLPLVEIDYAVALLEFRRIEKAQSIINKYAWDARFINEIEQLKQLITEINEEESSRQLASVPVSRITDGYTVEALLDGRVKLILLIDESEVLTGIESNILKTAGFNLNQYQELLFQTQSGTLKKRTIQIPGGLSVGEIHDNRFDIEIIDEVEYSNYDGILGANFLRNFSYRIDTNNNKMLISPIN